MSNSTIVKDVLATTIIASLHRCGYMLKQLASELGLNDKVLSRKLHGSNGSFLTVREVRDIVFTLARWHAITSQGEVMDLCELAHLPANIFREDEWASSPLGTLTRRHVQPEIWAVVRPLNHSHNGACKQGGTMSLEDVVALYHVHAALYEDFERLISSELYWHIETPDEDPLPDGWHESVTQLVSGLHAHADSIEAVCTQATTSEA